MTDYLSNLMDRFIQPEAGVRARPISLFEPQTNFDFSVWRATGTKNIEKQEMFEQSSDLQARATKPDSQQQSTASVQAYMSRSEIKPRHHPVPAEQERPTAAVPNSKPPTQLGYLVVHPRFQQDQSVLNPSFSEMIPASQADRPRLEPERGASLEEGTPHLGGQTTIGSKETPPNPGVKKIIYPQLREAMESPRSIHLNAQITAENDASPTESVINVTIGRVEVLAIPPSRPAKAPKTSRPNPVMSLDEYLKNRDQERQP